jgi:hypothetical protein
MTIDNTGMVTIPGTGNVGIGTANPATSLEIWRNGGATTTLVNSNTVISAGDLLGALQFRSEDNSTNGTLVKAYVQGVAETTFTGGNHRSALYFGTANADVVATTKMVLNSDGNLGIGDTSPAALLTVGSGDLFQVNSSGAIAAATGFTTTGNITISSAQILGASPLVFEGATDDNITTTLAFTDPTTSNKTITFPNETGTVCTTGSVCSGYQASGSYANTALSNLASVAINTALLPASDDSIDLGSSSYRFRDLYLGPTSLHLYSTASETTTARDWKLSVQETDGASEGNLRLLEGATEIMNVTPGGNVGIGDTTPASLLTVGASDAFQVNSSGVITSGTWQGGVIGAAYGGTGVNGVAAANGSLLIGNGSGYTLATLTQGSGITVTNGAGSITIAASGSGITSLNGLTGATQTFAVGTSGTDFNIASSVTTHTFNLPDASGSARGAVTTGTQTFAGAKTFSSQIASTVATGTAPFSLSSTTKVTNLNADLLDGFDSSAFGDATAANQTTILSRIGQNSDGASLSSSLFAGIKYVANRQFKMQTFTSSGTWTWPGSHVSEVQVSMVGGGGGGGGGNSAKGGGGGGGGQSLTRYPVTVSGNVTVTVGGGGGGGGANTSGSNGGDTSFGSITAAGGKGGVNGGGVGGNGGGGTFGSSSGVNGNNASGDGFGSGGGGGGGGGLNGGTPGGKGGSSGSYAGGSGTSQAGAGGAGLVLAEVATAVLTMFLAVVPLAPVLLEEATVPAVAVVGGSIQPVLVVLVALVHLA